jgi:hypothetical protein
MPWFVAFWPVSADGQRPSLCSPSYRERGSGFETEGIRPSAIFTRVGTQQFSNLLPTEDILLGRPFRWDEEVWEAVPDWLAQQTQDFFFRGMYGVAQHWKTRVERGGVWVEE